MANAVELSMRVAYPRNVVAGARYLVSVDLDHALSPEKWTYKDEEYPVKCFLEAAPFFDQEPAGESTIVVHRHGGSYGPAKFWLTARDGLAEGAARIRVVLVNNAGVPVAARALEDIKVGAKGSEVLYRRLPGEAVVSQRQTADTPAAAPAPGANVAASRSFRWLHLADLKVGAFLDFGAFRTSVLEVQKAVGVIAGRIDAIIVSGDITESGNAGQFVRASEYLKFVREVIAESQRGAPPVILMVPGNHDAERGRSKGIPTAAQWAQDSNLRADFWMRPHSRQRVENAFERFVSWELRRQYLGTERVGLLPGDFAYTMDAGGLKVGIIGLNDSFIGAPYGTHARADLHDLQLRAVCNNNPREWAARHDLRILVTHHDSESMPEATGRNFYRQLAPRSLFDLHLFGATGFKKRGIHAASDGDYDIVGINAIRMNGKAPQGFVIGEAKVSGQGGMDVWASVFAQERPRGKFSLTERGNWLLPRRPTVSAEAVSAPAFANAVLNEDGQQSAEEIPNAPEPMPVANTGSRTFRWMHLADLKFGEKSNARVNVAGQFARLAPNKDIDAIIISGDLAYSGKPQEYDEAGAFIRELRDAIQKRQGRGPVVIAVPGNHDLDRSAAMRVPSSEAWARAEGYREQFWASETDRQGVERAFGHFMRWCTKHQVVYGGEKALLPGDFAFSMSANGINIGIIGLNDSFIRPPFGDDPRADVDDSQLRAVCGDPLDWASRHDLRILITHHHPEAMPTDKQTAFYTRFAPRALFDIHLYGATKYKTRHLQEVHDGDYPLAVSNGIRLDGKAPQGFSIGEAIVVDGEVTVTASIFESSHNARLVKAGAWETLRLGRRPAAGAPPQQNQAPDMPRENPDLSNADVGNVGLPPVSTAPVHQRLALFVGFNPYTRKGTPAGLAKITDALFAIQFNGQSILEAGGHRNDLLEAIIRACKDATPDDLLLLVYAPFSTGAARFANTRRKPVKKERHALTYTEVFAIARTTGRRLLVIGDLGGEKRVQPGCGLIGDIIMRDEKNRFTPAGNAVMDALHAAAREAMTVDQFARLVDAGMGRLRVGNAQDSVQLSPEIAGLAFSPLLARENPDIAPEEPTPEQEVDRPPVKTPVAAVLGFDEDFLLDFRVPRPTIQGKTGALSPNLSYVNFSVEFCIERKLAWYAAVNVDLRTRHERSERIADAWLPDKSLPSEAQLDSDFFRDSPFDRSRLVKRMQPAWGERKQAIRGLAATDYYSNVIPLTSAANQNRLWVELPDHIATHHASNQRLSMLAGPWFQSDDPEYRGVKIPMGCWRLFVYADHFDRRCALAFMTFQTEWSNAKPPFPMFSLDLPRTPLVTRVSVSKLESLAGLEFGGLVSADLSPESTEATTKEGFPGEVVEDLELANPAGPAEQSPA
jgi:DNA/RNA endonuclease G (NUC1)/3',5'-cyclic AMP phosphodiesterase CpdA